MHIISSQFQTCIEIALGLSLGCYLLGVGWFFRGIRIQVPQGKEQPLVSVVVAARNEEARLGACLDCLLQQDYPAYEVLVVDDGSQDRTADLVRQRQREGVPLRLLVGHGAGKKAALTMGIAAARGELILTTDADCLVPRTWVSGMAACFGPQVGMVVGFSQIGHPGQTRTSLAGWEGVDFLNLMGAALGSLSQGAAWAASGQNLAFRKEVFALVGGYHEVQHRASGDDVLLLQLVRRLGTWDIVFSTAAATFVVHPPSVSWTTLLAQRARWASNGPYQMLLNRGFFGYMAAVFALNLLLALSPLLVLGGGLSLGMAGLAWGGKILAEGLFFGRTARFFGRKDLRRYFPLWVLSQPFYLVAAGSLGSLGIFTWKGKRHRWGKRS